MIVDLPEVSFHLPEHGAKPEGLIASYRYGLFAPGRSRVVMELAQPAVVSALHVDQNARAGRSSWSSSCPGWTGRISDARRLTSRGREGSRPSRPWSECPGFARDRDRSGPWRHRSRRRGPVRRRREGSGADLRPAPEEEARRRRRYRVLMTREQDVFISLGDRVRSRRMAKADLFISIHADSISGAGCPGPDGLYGLRARLRCRIRRGSPTARTRPILWPASNRAMGPTT